MAIQVLSGETATADTASLSTSARWFEVSSPYGVGFVHSSLVFNQTSEGHC